MSLCSPPPTPTRERLAHRASQLAIALCLIVSSGCSLLLSSDDPGGTFTPVWEGCYLGGTPQTGLILETALDDEGNRTAMLTGCLAIGIGTPDPRMATLSGIAQGPTEIELSDGEILYLLTRDDQGTESRLDDTVTITGGGRTTSPVPACNMVDPPTCDDVLGGATPDLTP